MSNVTAQDAALSLFDEYADKIYEFAKYSLGNAEDAEDLVQEVFMRVYRTWGHKELDNPGAWIWTIARNLIRDAYRRRSRHKEQPVADLERWTPEARGPDTLVEVEDVLMELSDLERQVVFLRLIQDMPVEATATALGSSSINVRVTLHRAIRKLRVLLTDDAAVPTLQRRNPR